MQTSTKYINGTVLFFGKYLNPGKGILYLCTLAFSIWMFNQQWSAFTRKGHRPASESTLSTTFETQYFSEKKARCLCGLISSSPFRYNWTLSLIMDSQFLRDGKHQLRFVFLARVWFVCPPDCCCVPHRTVKTLCYRLWPSFSRVWQPVVGTSCNMQVRCKCTGPEWQNSLRSVYVNQTFEDAITPN